ncbi:MAG: ArsC family transcriptional regulator [Planctomycetes bacterium RIFCSPHIGHO2_02_FULL_38_41]|nr:MAG: ArsC family transcriptional regulator [Planctomycetes bacterium RIFCSPHIGHO2_02_FULL_38_41]OHB96707.1 MAG: ArsC family transcriptional regulator [Planctomycetes bacterium RIFCSPLOWO2_12_38_17]
MKEKVLFICTHNSARSQMAEGFLRAMYGDYYDVYSAGIEPSKVNPYAIKVMAEIGIDISTQYSKNIDVFSGIKFDYVVTVCNQAKERCPFFQGGKEYLHCDFEDPSQINGNENQKLTNFKRVRDAIRNWIEKTFSKKDVNR